MSSTPRRIYRVRDTAENVSHLVRARSPAAAVAAVTRPRFAAAVASQDEIVELLTNGHAVVDGDAPAEVGTDAQADS